MMKFRISIGKYLELQIVAGYQGKNWADGGGGGDNIKGSNSDSLQLTPPQQSLPDTCTQDYLVIASLSSNQRDPKGSSENQGRNIINQRAELSKFAKHSTGKKRHLPDAIS